MMDTSRRGWQTGLMFLGIVLSVACASIPPDALVLKPDSLQTRQLQTRRFDGATEEDLLSATAAVLQDLGFTLDESETKLGLVVASKKRDATSAGQVIGAVALALFGGGSVPIDKEQNIQASVVVIPGSEVNSSSHFIRLTVQRTIVDTAGQISKRELITDPEIYSGFFDRLSKAVFLEAHGI